MRIPVFVSCPTALNRKQESAHQFILRELARLGLEARAIGRSDYPTDLPLREVLVVARRCAGGLVLGFKQFECHSWMSKLGTREAKRSTSHVAFPTPWNQLEAGVLFGLQLPMVVFAEDGVHGGIFDVGTADVFVHRMPTGRLGNAATKELTEVFLKWQASVRAVYYGLPRL